MTDTGVHPRRVGLYLRISRDTTGEGAGVQRQETRCRTKADELGWQVVEVYVDNDVSATKKKGRPAYQRMLADIQAGKVDAIICWHPDRLYRKATDLAELVEIVQEHKVAVATVQAGDVDLTSPTGLLVADMLAAIAMYEVRHKTARWKASWQQKRERGELHRTGRRMFGYTQELDVVEHEAAVAREMARRIASGVPLSAVCRWLRDEGVRSTRGKEWTNAMVKRYLTNPRLAGWATLNGEIVARGKWEPLVDQETFESIRAMLLARTRPHIPRRSVLLNLLFCQCGHRMISSSSSGKTVDGTRQVTRRYVCSNRPGQAGCGKVSIHAEHLEAYVEGYARERLNDPKVRRRISQLQHQPAELLAEMEALSIRVIELERQLDQPGVPVDAILRAIVRAKERHAELEAQVRSTIGAGSLPAAGAPWPEDVMLRHQLVALVVGRVVVSPRTASSPPRFDTGRIDIIPSGRLRAVA